MTRHAGRVLATALLAAMCGAAWAAMFYFTRPTLRLDFATDPPRLVSGLYPVERDDNTRTSFVWTRDEVTIRLPGLDRRVAWSLDLRARGGRADGNPEIAVFSDGLPIGASVTGVDFQPQHFDIPPRPDRLRGATISLRVSSTFVPGPSDPRPLGVMLDHLSLTPAAAVLAPRPALAGSALSSGIMGVAIATIGVTAGSAIVSAALLSAATAAIICRGFGPYTSFPETASWVALWVAAALTLGTFITGPAFGRSLRNTAKFAAAFTAAAAFLRLLVLLHPDMPIGDAMFQAHRFQTVLRGEWFFTSIAPGGYQFPYAPGLYLVAAPFARFVARGAADMTLLRIVVVATDALAALLIYAIVVHAWRHRLVAAMATALYALTPLDFSVVRTGNLTNAFAQSVAVGALALFAWRGVRRVRERPTILLLATLTLAFLSHTSTFALLSCSGIVVAGMMLLRGGPALRGPAIAIAVATVGAVLLSVGLYYAHFIPTYQQEFARIGHETASGAPTPGNRTLLERVVFIAYLFRICFGVALPVLAVLGGWWLYRVGAADRLALTIAGWLIACAAFLALGIATPIDMRYYLAAIPVVAILAARGAAQAWERGKAWRIAAAVLLAWCLLIGIRTWWEAIA